MKRKIIPVQIFEAEEGGYYAKCRALGAYTQGEDFEEIMRNIKEALQVALHDEDLEELGYIDNPRVRITYEMSAPNA